MPELQPVDPQHLAAARAQVRGSRSVVVKVGSNVLVGAGLGVINRHSFCGLVESIANLLVMADRRLVLVTSGAVAIGRRQVLGTSHDESGEESLARQQALAAIGQPALMHLYAEEFGFYGKQVSQVLVTRDDMGNRERFLNARNTLRELGQIPDLVPIVNENDTVANDELRFGDNDSLAALVTTLVGADALVILSDVTGLFASDPACDPNAVPIPHAYGDDPALLEIAGPSSKGYGRGGMSSKVRAAKVACLSGVATVVAAGRAPAMLGRLLSGEEIGTLFVPRESRLSSRKAWIGFGSQPEGVITIDDGAAMALRSGGRSLLPGGIAAVAGDFSEGAAVAIRNGGGETIGRGLVAYSAVDLQRIAGEQSDRIHELLGYHNGDAAIHADDMVLVDE